MEYLHADLNTTQIYTRVSIRELKEIHTATHPAKLKRKKEKKCRSTSEAGFSPLAGMQQMRTKRSPRTQQARNRCGTTCLSARSWNPKPKALGMVPYYLLLSGKRQQHIEQPSNKSRTRQMPDNLRTETGQSLEQKPTGSATIRAPLQNGQCQQSPCLCLRSGT